jgi:outer membrane protein OmpA-like peptidoglycan-associated protein
MASSAFLNGSLRRAATIVALLLAWQHPVLAQSSTPRSVETYTDQAIPQPLPEGIELGRPLKAGDLYLKKKEKTPPTPPAVRPKYPVGELQPPKLKPVVQQAKPPSMTAAQNSSTRLMMMQGMKSALQQVGQNPEVPPSNIEVTDHTLPKQPPATAAATSAAENVTPTPAVSQDGTRYVAGQEPRDLSDTLPLHERNTPLEKRAAPATVAEAPKATDLSEPPSALADASETPAAGEESIFGAPVREDAPAARTVAESAASDTSAERTSVARSAPPESPSTTADSEDFQLTDPTPEPTSPLKTVVATCEPKVTSWTKSCQDVGYADNYDGSIDGETRIECPDNAVQDVWLSNSCTATAHDAPPAAVAKTKTAHVKASSKTPLPQPAPAAEVEATPAAETDSAYSEAAVPAAENDEPQSVDHAPAADIPTKSADVPCEPKVTSWTKSCQDVGYPDSFGGSIEGETRIECPDNAVQDVWLSNNCAPGTTKKTPVKAAKAKTAPAKPLVGTAAPSPVAAATGGETPLAPEPVAPALVAEPPLAPPTIAAPPPPPEPKAAPLVVAKPERIDALCGSAHSLASESAPTTDLCAVGLAGSVHGDGPWTWACSGQNGGKPATCESPRRVAGLCGAAANTGHDKKPTRDLCLAGAASAVNGAGPWSWTCAGEHGGQVAECQAIARQNGVCGLAATTGQRATPSEGLCDVGEPSSVDGQGPWSWTCRGSNGGSDITCNAALALDGQCGAAHGTAVQTVPQDELCAAGTVGKVSGKGPWQWSCQGIAGGQSASCIASKGEQAKAEAPPANPQPVAADTKPAAELCGPASQNVTDDVPSTGLCASGLGSSAWYNAASQQWNWECQSEDGAVKSLCVAKTSQTKTAVADAKPAPKPQQSEPAEPAVKTKPAATSEQTTKLEAAPVIHPEPKPEPTLQCGAANGVAALEKPAGELCENGKPSVVSQKHTDWVWSCAQGKKAKISCTAPVILDAVCGAASGTAVSSKPLSSLCQVGSATVVAGDGPWQWSCLGENGGLNVSCSASRPAPAAVEGRCGPAALETATAKPADGLCLSGNPSAVYGEGPYSWTCSGQNGGVAANCLTQAPVQPQPQAPLPGPLLDGLCGLANGVPAESKPMSGLCSTGTVTGVTGNGPWNWNCLGANGGMSVSCTAPLMPPPPVNGVCGSSNGLPTLTAPRSGLCDGGIASNVNGNGPWTWSCSGINGGTAVSCVSPLATAGGTGPLPSLVQPTLPQRSFLDDAPAPAAAPVGLVTPRLPNGSLPPFRPVPGQSDVARSAVDIPAEAPSLPQGLEPVQPPPIRDASLPPAGLRPPVIDGTGAVVPGQRLRLESSVSTIAFETGSDMLQSEAADALNQLSAILLSHGNARITLTAYADNSGVSAREARRLSLARALTIRDYLVTKGIASGRIDVRALGANVSSGDPDRVDVKVN